MQVRLYRSRLYLFIACGHLHYLSVTPPLHSSHVPTTYQSHTHCSLVNQTQFHLTSDFHRTAKFHCPMKNRKLGGTGSGLRDYPHCTPVTPPLHSSHAPTALQSHPHCTPVTPPPYPSSNTVYVNLQFSFMFRTGNTSAPLPPAH